ncbi:hypothetical protein FQN52_002788 [Onygenales sp. PD_12]|nr:hypothetical protein FQN52_002788 [Onygenales sp. PD_12]
MPNTKSTPDDFPRIYLFGDSLTDRAFYERDCGFGWKLGQYYDGRVEVVNQGHSGETSRSLRREFERGIIKKVETRGSPPAPLFITIFLGANDACLLADSTYVPLPEYEEHIRHYITTILEHPLMQETKIILIAPPPVDVPSSSDAVDDLPEVAEVLRAIERVGRGHRTWQSKRLFAKKIIEIGRDFEGKTGRVAVMDFWTMVTKAKCEELAISEEAYQRLDERDMLPGSGMPGAKEFGKEWFVDGLHFGKKAYEVLGRELLELLLAKWPALEKQNFPLRVGFAPYIKGVINTILSKRKKQT